MGAKALRFIYCVELLLLLAAAPGVVWAQSETPTGTPTPTVTPLLPTPTLVNTDTPMPTATPTSTNTYDPWATPTWTYTPSSPTNTPTLTVTITPTGTILTSTPTWTNTPSISRSSLVLLPTAYSNAWDRWDGFNWDIDFTYYIGSIVSRDFTDPQNKLDSLEQINIMLLTSDVKYAWMNDNGNMPGIASGLMTSLLAQVGSGDSSTGTGTEAFQVAGNAIGSLYTVASKTLFKGTAVHFGYMYGLKDLSNKIGAGVFTYDYSQLLPYFGPGLSGLEAEGGTASIFYTGFNTYFLGRSWKFEIWKPFPMDQHPILFNTQIEGLPLAFNLGYERWDEGFAVLGYVNFRIPLLPSTPAY